MRSLPRNQAVAGGRTPDNRRTRAFTGHDSKTQVALLLAGELALLGWLSVGLPWVVG